MLLNMRKKLIFWMFNKTQKSYLKYKKKTPWTITRGELLLFAKDTLGYHLGTFLKKNDFQLIPKVEEHDVFHVLTNCGVQVEDEVALQFACFGNGKRSLFLFMSLLIGLLVLPEYYKHYWHYYKLGKKSKTFYNLAFKQWLPISITEVRNTIFLTNK